MALAVVMEALLTGCATTPKETPEQAYQRFKREEFVLYATTGTNASVPLLALQVRDVTLDGQVMLIHPSSPWANAIRNAITNLFTELQDRHVFRQDREDSTGERASLNCRGALTFIETTHLHGGSLAKGALVAGLTLGILDNSPVKFDLQSTLDLQLTRQDGVGHRYAVTNTVTGENRKRDNGAGWSAARVRANALNVTSLAGKMSDDNPFYAGQR